MATKTLKDLKNIVGKDGIDPGIKKLANIPQKDRATSEDIILKQLKSNAKKFYLTKVKDMIKEHIELGADANSPLIEDYKNLLTKIKSM